MPKIVDIEAKRAEFLAASVDLIAQEGLPAATLRRVAQGAGCTTGALTHYFASREDLLRDTLRAVHAAAGERMAAVLAQIEDPTERLRGVVFESLPLRAESVREWRVWLAFWGAAMDDAALTRENTRRYDEWSGLLETLLVPFVSEEARAFEARTLLMLIDGLGTDIARQKLSARGLKAAQVGCESHALIYLARFG